MSCGCHSTHNDDLPLLRLTLVGQGEPLIRMGKRLGCAASGAGVRLNLDIVKDNESLGIDYADTPCVMHEGKILTRGVIRAETLDIIMRELVNAENKR
jgi:hypothetical protein